MKRGRKQIEVPSRTELVKLLNNSAGSPRTLAASLGISHVTIHKWINELEIKSINYYK